MTVFKEERDFLFFWIARSLSVLGDWVLDIALPVWIYQLTGSATLLGAVAATSIAPNILLAPVVGAIVERLPYRNAQIGTYAALGLVTLALLTVQDGSQMWIIFAVAFINGCLSTVLAPVRVGWIPELVSDENLNSANALMTSTVQGMRLVGPALAGFLIATVPVSILFILDALSFFAAALLLLPITPQAKPERSEEEQSLVKDVTAGIALVWRTPLLRTLISVWGVMMFAAGVVQAVLIVFVHEALGGTDASFGYLMAIQGAGMVLGGVLVMTRWKERAEATMFAYGLVAFSALFLLGANAPTFAIAALAVFGMGGAMAVVAIADLTLVQRHSPTQFRARIGSLNDTTTATMALMGALVAGVVADWLGVRVAFNLAALMACLSTLVAWQGVRPHAITHSSMAQG